MREERQDEPKNELRNSGEEKGKRRPRQIGTKDSNVGKQTLKSTCLLKKKVFLQDKTMERNRLRKPWGIAPNKKNITSKGGTGNMETETN